MPIQIVFDTNVIFNRWYLEGPSLSVVEQLVRGGVCKLVMPEIVVIEVKSKYKEALMTEVRHISQMNAVLPPEKRIPRMDVDEACGNYEEYLDEKLRQLGGAIPSHSDIAQDDIVARLFKKRKPFGKKETTDRGYRDTLLWEVIMRKVARKDVVTVLITKNKNDFADENDGCKLHRDLLEDMKNCGMDEGSICLFPSLERWVSEQGIQYLEVTKVANELKSGRYEEFSLVDWFTSERETFTEELNRRITDVLSYWHEIDEASVVYLEDPESIGVDEAYSLDKETIYLRGQIVVGVNIDGLLDRWEYDPETSRLPIVLADTEWSKYCAFVCLYTKMPLGFSATFDVAERKVTSFELDDIEIWSFCRHCGAAIISDAAEGCWNCNREL